MLKSGFLDAMQPLQKVDLSEKIEINTNEMRIWYVGHATVLINFFGTTILTDPVLVNWIPFPRRIVAPGYRAHEIPHLDYILVSHAHFDHFNKPTLKKLAQKTNTIVIPHQCSDLLFGLGYNNIVELNWGISIQKENVTIHAVKPQHWGRRIPWENVVRHYSSYIIEKNGVGIFFGGDSGYGPFYKKVEEKFDIDVALLSIGAYSPPSFRKMHKNPEDALRAFSDLQAKHMIPIHFGSFRLSLEPMEEPPALLATLAEEQSITNRVHILKNGESFVYT